MAVQVSLEDGNLWPAIINTRTIPHKSSRIIIRAMIVAATKGRRKKSVCSVKHRSVRTAIYADKSADRRLPTICLPTLRPENIAREKVAHKMTDRTDSTPETTENYTQKGRNAII